MKPREFILHGGKTYIFGKCGQVTMEYNTVTVSEGSAVYDPTDIHVIEYSAYEGLENGYNNLMNGNDKIKAELHKQITKLTEQNLLMREALENIQRQRMSHFLSKDDMLADKMKIAGEALAKCGSTEPTTKETK